MYEAEMKVSIATDEILYIIDNLQRLSPRKLRGKLKEHQLDYKEVIPLESNSTICIAVYSHHNIFYDGFVSFTIIIREFPDCSHIKIVAVGTDNSNQLDQLDFVPKDAETFCDNLKKALADYIIAE